MAPLISFYGCIQILLLLLRPLRRQISVYKHFSGAGKVCINTSPAPERCFQILPRLFQRGEVYLNISPALENYNLSDTSPAPEKLGKYLKTPFRRRKSIYTHFSGAGEVLIYTYLAPERPEKYLYTPKSSVKIPSLATEISCLPVFMWYSLSFFQV